MTIEDLTAALNGLSTARLQRLADGLERDAEVKVTVGAWRPQCPMVLAGYDPMSGSGHGPEDRFANVWDRFASSASGWRLLPRLGREARRGEVQALLRATNAVLAARLTPVDLEGTPPDAPSVVGSDGGRP
ncbi:MAG TPA: hypothetical protein VHY18_08855 [Solirubrobacteraceae bacterium]|nr:hypothetical protein [Solirubrobacteraceae bacterium]